MDKDINNRIRDAFKKIEKPASGYTDNDPIDFGMNRKPQIII
jgi:hypothetical protein